MLKLKNITKQFSGATVIHPLSLDFAPKKITALIGPSGCGKSTLLKIIVGLVEPDSGSVELLGETLNKKNILALRKRIGYVIQEGGLFPHLTAQENITLMARYLKEDATKISERTTELVEMCHFQKELLERYPNELSGGQRQRVALMRALMLDPDLILLDEPLGALDPMIRANLQEELRNIFQTLDKTVILVTHDIGEAGYFSDHILLMKHGKVEQSGTLEDLVHTPKTDFVNEFINAQRSPLESLR